MSTAKPSSKTIRSRIAALREQMKKHSLAAYLVPSTDAHQSEYLPECWQRRPFISGFTGSAGDVLVRTNSAGLWTDGRYYLQAGIELKGTGVTLFKAADPGTPAIEDYLAAELTEGDAVGVDPRVVSDSVYDDYAKALSDRGIHLVAIDENLVDAIWEEQPAPSSEPIMSLATRYTGESTASKLRRVRKEMKKHGASAHVVTTLDSIAWLFNIRGRDVDFNPVAIAYGIITNEDATLFIDLDKVPSPVAKKLGKGVSLAAYDGIGPALEKLSGRVWIDPKTCNRWVVNLLAGTKVIKKESPIPKLKARKNEVEIAGMVRAHVRDGVAMVRFLRWLEDAVPGGDVTEISAADELQRIRSEGEGFQGLSFRTISGYAEHGAIIHYSVDETTDVPLRAKGIYLIDSGAQYLDGTTDITRTVLLGGKATREQKDRFTRVLKGHIALARVSFPEGVAGIRLDTLARLPLWNNGLDYGHGTGHGVGAFLNVHEGPPSISVRGHAALEAGNILSNEPGFYEPGAYGIRIENLVVIEPAEQTKKASKNGRPSFLRFNTITLCPIDTRLVEPKLLDGDERKWLNDYHGRVYRELSPLLESAERRWLKQATKKI